MRRDIEAAEEEVSSSHAPLRDDRAELIRRAVRFYRKATETQAGSFRRLLEDTSGIWKGEDGLSYQLRVRDEWADR